MDSKVQVFRDNILNKKNVFGFVVNEAPLRGGFWGFPISLVWVAKPKMSIFSLCDSPRRETRL
jgi:hypothetical protein